MSEKQIENEIAPSEGQAWSTLHRLRQRADQSFGNFYLRYVELRSQIPAWEMSKN